MIRTLHVVTSMHRRGAEIFAVQLADRLDRSRFLPHIWPLSQARSGDALTAEQTPVLPNGAGSLPQAVRQFRQAVRTVRPHVIQCHGGRALKYALALKPFWRSRTYVYNKNLSIHPHLDRTVRRLPYKFLFEQVDAIVAEDDALLREVEEVFHPRRPRLVTIRNGRDLRPFLDVTPEVVAEKRRELGLDAGQIGLIQVGIAWEKAPQVSMDLFMELAPRFPDLRLALVGEGPLLNTLRESATARGLTDRVRILGVRHDVPALLASADILLLPSITEGVPGVLIEAGMAGRAAVAHDVGSVRNVLVDGVTGWVVAPGDRAALTAKVAALAGDRGLRERMGREAMARCRRDFNIDTSVRAYEGLFAELVGGDR